MKPPAWIALSLVAFVCGGAARAEPAPDQLAVQQVLQRAHELSRALEYADVIVLANGVVKREDATVEQRLDGYLLLGSASAIIGDTITAERAFRFLLTANPDFDLGADASPTILGPFRKVQFEQRAIHEQLEKLQRKRIIEAMALDGADLDELDGGQTWPFRFRLRDPHGAAERMVLSYRRADERDFSALALELDDTGQWVGELPGEWSANADGFVFEYFVSSLDHSGTQLLAVGSRGAPLAVPVSAGEVGSVPIYHSPWFWTVVGVAVAGAVVGGVVAVDQARTLPSGDLPNSRVD